MGFLVLLTVVVVALAILDLAAALFGADSREGFVAG
jgi:hypothetical protein